MAKPSLAAVVITYNSDVEVSERLQAIKRECGKVYIVDNGSTPRTLKVLRIVAKKLKIQLIELGENTGIAHAQNVGLRLAFANHADGVILFDHDSTPLKNFASTLWRTYIERADRHSPVIVGSRVFDVNLQAFARHPVYNGFLFKRQVCPEQGVLDDALMAIASGTLISRDVFARVGGMREEFFIDYVDWEYCLRARQQYQIKTVICGAATLQHERGARIGKKIGGFTIYPPGYSLFRYRHMYRNRARLLREYFFHNPAFVAFDLLATCHDSMLLFGEQEPLRKFFMSLMCWFQGFFGYTGQN